MFEIKNRFLNGVRSGVNGTSAFFINDLRYDGSWDIGPLTEALEATASASAVR